MFPRLKHIILLLTGILLLNKASAQTTDVLFGQNRVQFKTLTWSYFKTDHFKVYYYLGGQQLGKYSAEVAERVMGSVNKQVEFKTNERIEILVFNNLADLKQSNIGSTQDEAEQNNSNIGGITHIIGNKIFVYFDGNHRHLEEQIKSGITTVTLEDMMFGGNIQEVLQSAVFLSLPDWYTNGLSAYLGEQWNTDLDNRLRDEILSGKYKKFNKLIGVDPTLIGQSLWYYISQKYGKSTIPNILYLTRINHSMESGFVFIIGKTSKQLFADWYTYFQNLYTAEKNDKDLPDKKAIVLTSPKRNKSVYNHIAADPKGKNLAYVTNDLGRYKVHLQDLDKSKKKIVLRGGFRNVTQPIDYSYPLLAWDPTGKNIAIVYEKRGKSWLAIYNSEKKKKEKKRILAGFQKVLSVDFTNDPRVLVLSAENKGQSDIYTYNYMSGHLNQITNDFWDDYDAHYIKLDNREGILFASNRKNDTLKSTPLDTLLPTGYDNIYFYNVKSTNTKLLAKLTHTTVGDELQSCQYGNHYFGFTSDQNGIRNRYTGYIDSVFWHYDHYYYFPDSTVVNPTYNIDSVLTAENIKPDSMKNISVYRDTGYLFTNTNYSKNILEQSIAPHAGKAFDLVYNNGKYLVYKTNLTPDSLLQKSNPSLTYTVLGELMHQEELKNAIKPVLDTAKVQKAKADTVTTIKTENVFQSEYSQISDITKADSSHHKKNNQIPGFFQNSKIYPYSVQFSTNYVVTQLTDGLLINQYEPYTVSPTTGQGVYINPPLSGLISFGATDLMEDYRIIGGLSIPSTFSGSQYFLTYENFKHRLDKTLTLYRSVTPEEYSTPITADGNLETLYGQFTLSYPLDFTTRISGSLGLRQDHIVYLSEDTISMLQPDSIQYWALFRGEYVFDNTVKISDNIRYGTRYLFFLEFQKDVITPNTYFTNLGVDFRHYEKIYHSIIWATRFNAATSMGPAKVLYYLGGTDGWMFPQFNTNTPVSTTENYAFQSLATNLRGFDQNARNGNSYALVNSEIRAPIYSLFSNTPSRSKFVNNFQVIGFFDAGSAWNGVSPYSTQNPFNTAYYTAPALSVDVNFYRQPIAFGWGFGIRSTIIGYFVRLDIAWGDDSGAITPTPLVYVSLGTDF
jgi:Tol biopolymer transport system component